MNVLSWVEGNPVLYFTTASLVLFYLYGFCWTLVILFTIYLIDETFRDTEEEKIFGKRLSDQRNKKVSTPASFNRCFFTSANPNMFTPNKNKNNNTPKKPSLQDLVYFKRKDNNTEKSADRQPLVAIIKNNISLHSTNVNLENRKPLYQCLKSASPRLSRVNASPRLSRVNASPSINNRINTINYNDSPSIDCNHYLNSSSLNTTNFNTTNYIASNTVIASPSGEGLEVHGSYFINKSILSSPEHVFNNTVASPAPVTVNRNIQSPLSILSPAESVVEALKLKSKRKRIETEYVDEADTKKKKTSNNMDSTMADLLPNTDISLLKKPCTKRKNMNDIKDLVSTGVQCSFDEEESVVKKSKIQTVDVNSPGKYGLSQSQIDKLSQKADTVDSTTITSETTIDETIKIDETISKLKKSIRNIAYESSFKTVSFSVDTPEKPTDKESNKKANMSKLSALKNMESPYKRLFKHGHLKNITPESVKKLRKHPVYFTAKIDIDEIQHHCEEYGESGVSLKAFRLDKEEALKRVDNLLDETDSEVDFNVKSVSGVTVSSTIIITSSTPTTSTLTSLNIKSNLFGSTTTSQTITSSTVGLSTPSFSLGGLTSLASFASSAPSTIATVTVASQNNTQSTTVSAASLFPTLSAPSISVSPPTFSFGSAATNASAMTSETTTSLPTIPASTDALPKTNFQFGFSANAKSSSSDQVASFQLPIVSSTTTTSVPEKAIVNPQSTAFPSLSIPAAVSQISFKPPSLPTTTLSSTQNQAATATGIKPPLQSSFPSLAASTAPLTHQSFGGVNTALPQSFNFGSAPVATVANVLNAGITLPTIVSSVAPSLPITKVATFSAANSNIFAAQPAIPNLFGSTTSTAAANPPPSMFSNPPVAATTTTTNTSQISQLPVFGVTPSLPSTQGFNPSSSATNNTFSSQSSGFAFGSASTASAGGFNFTTTTASTGFSFGTTASAPSTTGLSFSGATAATGFNFGTAAAASTAAPTFATTSSAPSQGFTFGQTSSSQAAPPPNIFGASAAPAMSQNIFGAPAATSNVFGAPASSAPATQNLFGKTTQNAFGASTQNTFGASANTNVFGSAQPSIFGDQTKSSAGGFNFGSTTTTTASSGFAFGATSSVSSAFGQSSVFGASTASNSSNVFGAAKPAENPFSVQPKPSGGFDFSSSLSAAPTINFGAAAAPAPVASGFAAAAQPNEIPKPTFNFGGSQPATPTFGAATPATFGAATPASPAFGNIPQPAFGSPQPFGTPGMNPASGGGFTIGSGTSNPPPSRQTQRARRRLRR